MNEPESAARWFVRHHERPLRLAAVALVGSLGPSACLAGVAVLVRHALERAIPEGRRPEMAATAAGILLLLVLYTVVRAVSMRIVMSELRHAIQRIREGLLARLYALPRSVSSTLSPATVHRVLVQETASLDGLSHALLVTFSPGVIVSASLGVLLLALDVRLALVMLAAMPVLALLGRSVGGRVKKLVRELFKARDTFNTSALFALQAIELTQARGAETLELERQTRTFDAVRRASLESVWWQAIYRLLQENVVAVFVIATIFVGGVATASGSLAPSDLVVIYVVLTLMRSHLADAVAAVPAIIEGLESLREVHALARIEGEAAPRGGRAIDFTGRVTLDAVSFRYGATPVLERVTLETTPGRIVAIVGPNGSGKTTLARLVLGFERPLEGAVLADGVSYDELDMAALRRQIGIVPQEPFIFSGTILENIAYGAPGAGPADVELAARRAAVDEFAATLPEGLATHVGTDGVLLSGGQRQRIALARALLGRPRLLVLDEPTNHLDAATTGALLGTLRLLSAATLIFTHDKELVRDVDEVFSIGARVLSRVDAVLPAEKK